MTGLSGPFQHQLCSGLSPFYQFLAHWPHVVAEHCAAHLDAEKNPSRVPSILRGQARGVGRANASVDGSESTPSHQQRKILAGVARKALHTPAPTGGFAGHTRWLWARSGRGHTRSDNAGRLTKSQRRHHQRLQPGVRPCGLDTTAQCTSLQDPRRWCFFPLIGHFCSLTRVLFLVKTVSLGDDIPVRDSRFRR